MAHTVFFGSWHDGSMDVFSNNPVTSFALTIIVQDEFVCTSNWPLCIADGVIGSLGKTGRRRSGLEPSMSN